MERKFVSNKDESVRMFSSDYLEIFTKVHFTVPLFLYIPLVSYFLYHAFASTMLGLGTNVSLFVGGMIIWTITEYLMHRFIFHFHPTSEWGKKIHFIFHGVHHDYPNDSNRLVMPPAVSIPLALLFYFGFGSFIAETYMYAFFSGFVTGYLIYDMLHYAIHHVNFDNKWWGMLKSHHLKHHFKDPDSGFGVSSPIWDIVVGTNFKKQKKSHSAKSEWTKEKAS